MKTNIKIAANNLLTDAVETVKIKNLAVSTDKIQELAVTKTRLAPLGQVISPSGDIEIEASQAGLWFDVPNLSVTISSTGRPIFLALISDGDPDIINAARFGAIDSSGGNVTYYYRFLRTDGLGQQVSLGAYINFITAVDVDTTMLFASVCNNIIHVDPAPPSPATYKFQIRTLYGKIQFLNWKLVAFEL